MRGQLVGLAASESMNLVFTMNAAERTLMGISRESDEVVPLAHLVGTPLAFCVLEDGKVCSLERDARQPQRRAFLVYDIDSDAVEQTVLMKEKEQEAKKQALAQAATNGGQLIMNVNVEDDEVITSLRLGRKQPTDYESDTIMMHPDSAGDASSGKFEGFQSETDNSLKTSFVYKPLCSIAIDAKKDANNERADVFKLEHSIVVIALSGHKSVHLAKIVKNLDNNQITALLTKQKLRERLVAASFNRSTRLIAVSFRDNSLTVYDTNWVARSNFACTYNGNPIELRSVAFTSMHTAIATIQLTRSPSSNSAHASGSGSAPSIAPRTELLFADGTGNERQLRFFAASPQMRQQLALESPCVLLMPEWKRVLALVLDHSGASAPALAEYAIDYDYVLQE